jgi:hypothetical protein
MAKIMYVLSGTSYAFAYLLVISHGQSEAMTSAAAKTPTHQHQNATEQRTGCSCRCRLQLQVIEVARCCAVIYGTQKKLDLGSWLLTAGAALLLNI